MKGLANPCELRIALHYGQFNILHVKFRKNDTVQLVGTGFNECARLISFADKLAIVVSEKLLHLWRDNEGPDVCSNFSPPDGPFIAKVKHNKRMPLYWYADTQSHLPTKVDITQSIEYFIDRFVAVLHEEIGPSLLSSGIPFDSASYDPRISLFELREDEQSKTYLMCSKYRHGSINRVGTVKYSIEDGGKGPVGKAFVSGDPKCYTVSVKYEDNPRSYCEQLHYKTGLSFKEIELFQRKAQTFITIPFGFRKVCDGVLCIDFASRFDDIDEDKFRIFVEKLMANQLNLELAWKLL